MSTPALFLLDPLPAGDEIVLDGPEGRHAARVKRLAVGEEVLVCDGVGAVLSGVVSGVAADAVTLRVRARRFEPVPEPRIVVVQALPKGDRGELAVEVLTELGVDEIVPWAASRSIAQWHGLRGEKSLEKWRRTAAEATKQSRRARVPVIASLASTSAVAERLVGGAGLVLHEDAGVPLASVPLAVGGEIVVVVGPEGGIAPDELARFTAAGAVAVRLGRPVLRTSTAGAAALAALSARLGRWG